MVAVLRPTGARPEVFTAAGVLQPYEPILTVVGGTDCLTDDDDSTYVSLVPTGVLGHLTSTPHFVADIPALGNVASINSVTWSWRLRYVPTAESSPGYIRSRMQLFVSTLPGALADPYELDDTITLAQDELFGADFHDWTDFGGDITIQVHDLGWPGFIAALETGRLHVRYMYIDDVGDITDQQVSEMGLTVDYVPSVRPPLRQFPRDDGLATSSVTRSARAASRQASIRRGPAGTYL